MKFEILTVGAEVIGQRDFQEVVQGVYLEEETGTVAVLDREGTAALLVERP